MLTQLTDSPVFDPVVFGFVDIVLDQTGYAVFFIRNDRVVADIRNRQFRQHLFCCHTFLGVTCRDTRQDVPGAEFVSFRENVFHVPELVGLTKQRGFQFHITFPQEGNASDLTVTGTTEPLNNGVPMSI